MNLLDFLRKLKAEHDSIDIYKFVDYFIFDTHDDLLKIATDPDLEDGVYVFSKNEKDVILRETDSDGRILLGFSLELSSSKTLYKDIRGTMVLDEHGFVSTSPCEEFLVMADAYGFERSILVKTTFDVFLNAINWYGIESQFSGKRRRKKNDNDV